MTVISSHPRLAVPMTQIPEKPKKRLKKGQIKEKLPPPVISFNIYTANQNCFFIKGLHVGRARMMVHIRKITPPERDPNSGEKDIILSYEYKVLIIRKRRWVDMIFDCVMALVAILTAFSLGLSTEQEVLKMQCKKPAPIIIAFVSQFLIMPLLSLGISKMTGLNDDLGLSLLYVACTPGGGMGFVLVSVMRGDIPVSVTLNFFTIIFTLGTAPLWIFVLGRFFHSAPDSDFLVALYNIELWLAAIVISYFIGMAIRRCRPGVADAILNWLIKPLLLLFCILFFTLGIYINMYMFEFVRTEVLVAAALLPFCGYLVSGVLSLISKQPGVYCKTIGTEMTVFNCMLVLVIIRFSFEQPDADIAAAMPIWVMFLTPTPFLFVFLLTILHKCIGKKCEKRREKKYRHFSIMSSLVNITQVSTISSPKQHEGETEHIDSDDMDKLENLMDGKRNCRNSRDRTTTL
ncbi:unnamed protein product [Owenia fusiformis]|uniref:Uncharacterized protein n=1 Tax=Owenia fusiformis TaxID=6347 RepID=A0A8S4MV56_OWEFU|nr:unnamed protein product [Owenia fusiformis]